MRGLGWALAALALALTAGCHSVPVTTSTAGLESAQGVADAAGLYWEAKGVPEIPHGERVTAAIVEFTVEYVTVKLQGVTKSQPVVFGTEYSTAGFVATTVGLGKETYTFSKELKTALPDVMYEEFVRQLTERGFDVLPQETVTAGKSYALFSKRKAGSTGAFQGLNVTGSDTGNPKRIEVYPAGVLSVLGYGRDVSINRAMRETARELGVDVVLRARFRLGAYGELASIERDSLMWVATADEVGELRSARSLVSPESAAEYKGFTLFSGQRYTVDADKYAAAIKEMFGSYVAMEVMQME